MDISALRRAKGKLTMFRAIEQVSKLTDVNFRDDVGKMNGTDFRRGMVSAFPYAIHSVLTDNGMVFADLSKTAALPGYGGHVRRPHLQTAWHQAHTDKPDHPCTNGRAERMNRTVKEAIIKALHYPDLESLKADVLAFVSAYNFTNHPKAIRRRPLSRGFDPLGHPIRPLVS